MKANYETTSMQLSTILDENKFYVPRYQRSVVWQLKRQKAFITTVREGNPFGVILVRRRVENNPCDPNGKIERYELIDGLQRITTLKKYCENKFNFLSYEDINSNLVKNLIKVHHGTINVAYSEDDVNIQKITEDYRKYFYECLNDNMKNYDVMTEFKKKYGMDDCSAINNAIDAIYSDFEKATDISSLTVPAIVYTGDENAIPDVFYNLNTGGATLSKYDTYAALWASWNYVVDDKEIIDTVMNKYDGINNSSDLMVDVDKEKISNDGINLYEYCYAMGGLLRNKCPNLFGETKNDKTDSLGFDFITILTGEQINKASELPKYFKNAPASFLIELKNTILLCAKEVEDSLNKIVIGITGKKLKSDSDYMLHHILYSYLMEYYEVNFQDYKIMTKKPNRKKERFVKYAPYWYLKDSISGYWQTNRQVQDITRVLQDENTRSKYWNKITEQEWKDAFDLFLSSQSTLAKPDFNNKLFIDFYYKVKLDKEPESRKYILNNSLNSLKNYSEDIEHIVTQDKLKTQISNLPNNTKKNYPISHIGNLCYLTTTENRAKGAKDIYESIERKPSLKVDQDYLDFLDYPKKGDLDFVDYSFDSFDRKYREFINNRAFQLRDNFIDLVK